ncbi:methylmalonyl-CoA mutase family protein [Carboxylicivirga sediminis]|uniref:Fused isobutyryl-CoA mutase n=1 Tax=Carboxylicivirga sediminis TaxID=2006564 RepID=A0A941F266_9BACT|nr:methylmalonyl-CoA mutase family protein [Carboxylicivirga sediminis]MBR8534385.1 methylmalonyl-CoA mutase family protein [Carboxylicivirga sediminis]
METIYQSKNKIRIVTATSLFDGHDAAINIMRRIMQASGAEVIHLGHNRSVLEIVDCAIQEDAQAIAVTSYQGGHMEFFKYMFDLLQEKGAGHIQLFGGGGGVILPHEIEELHQYGIAGIFSPDDGRSMGLQGMVNQLLKKADYNLAELNLIKRLPVFSDTLSLARCFTLLEMGNTHAQSIQSLLLEVTDHTSIPVIGITGTGGAGKSSLIDELVRRLLIDAPALQIAIVSIDPSKRKSGGALLGDRIRMNSIHHENVFMRSMATRQTGQAIAAHLKEGVELLKAAGADLIILETSGIGQGDSQIIDYSNMALYVMTPEFGAPSQLEKIDMLDFADWVVINKSDKQGADDALRDVKKQVQRNKQLWNQPTEEMPVYLTNASHCFDAGVNHFYQALTAQLEKDFPSLKIKQADFSRRESGLHTIIPTNRVRYLAEISETVRSYNKEAEEQADVAGKLWALKQSACLIKQESDAVQTLGETIEYWENKLYLENKALIEHWDELIQSYKQKEFVFKPRDKEIRIQTYTESLSHLKIPKIAVPKYSNWADILRWQLKENFPGLFPFAAGVFPFRREYEDPTRMFAGEGSPERTNKRFHYLSAGQPARRLSTAFDSVTLYGENPDVRPDIYGKVGNSGVSIATLDDVKKLYSGFDLCAPLTSVSMTINGPAPVLMAFFLNAAIDQQCEQYLEAHQPALLTKQKDYVQYNGTLPDGSDGLGLKLLGVSGDQLLDTHEYEQLKNEALCAVRGTVQADILKEDQAQNTCIYSVDFSLKMMGDVQEYFIKNQVRNFYSVSISGYHIAEAGANPVTQLAFTLANGFTYVEYYLSRGMHIDAFAPNLSFFFSNGIDPEFSVIGRVARLIWAKTIKYKYGGNEKSQKLKYHIQTSGRSLHVQEIEFNDIRTTLQALYAIYDNCNSLHTNAYDEAITTPTEESVRRAMAIQMIINHELGLNKNQNSLQGAFIIEELTELVEEAVLLEFERINARGGVLGAMETNYQRGKIQEESLHYERVKNTGELPLIGVNTYLSKSGSPTILPREVIRSSEEEKQQQLDALHQFHQHHKEQSGNCLERLKEVALSDGNIFEELMETVKYCSLGQITQALYEVGGQYRRNM